MVFPFHIIRAHAITALYYHCLRSKACTELTPPPGGLLCVHVDWSTRTQFDWACLCKRNPLIAQLECDPRICCVKQGSEVCATKSEDGPNPYFAPNIHIHAQCPWAHNSTVVAIHNTNSSLSPVRTQLFHCLHFGFTYS